MTFLLLNQTFHPDVASTAQHLSDVAVELRRQGHEVTVITSRRAYDNPDKRFPASEVWRGIRIVRVWSTGFGKGAKWKRAADFASFLLACAWRMMLARRPDVVVALTSPPLISFLGACLARFRGCRFVYWVMDFNPDEAIAAGWLRAGSLAACGLDAISRFSLRHATNVIALDRFMAERIKAKGIEAAKVEVIPPWSHDDEVRFDAAGREQFRARHGLADKFVVMYSGNHSPCHPLDTLLAAADRLAHRRDIVFLFVGGGSEFGKVAARAARGNERGARSGERGAASRGPRDQRLETKDQGLGTRDCGPGTKDQGLGTETPKHRNTDFGRAECPTPPPPPSGSQLPAPCSMLAAPSSPLPAPCSHIHCLPYQPLRELAGSLSAADLHVVVMGDPFVGLVHPCKIYNILSVAAPVLYIGPRPSHLSEILDGLEPAYQRAGAGHGEVDRLVRQIEWAAGQRGKLERRVPTKFEAQYSQRALLPAMIKVLVRTER